MKTLFSTLILGALCAPAIAQLPISYSELIEASHEDLSPPSAVGRLVKITNCKLGDLGYFVNKAYETTVLCKSGDPALIIAS